MRNCPSERLMHSPNLPVAEEHEYSVVLEPGGTYWKVAVPRQGRRLGDDRGL